MSIPDNGHMLSSSSETVPRSKVTLTQFMEVIDEVKHPDDDNENNTEIFSFTAGF